MIDESGTPTEKDGTASPADGEPPFPEVRRLPPEDGGYDITIALAV